MQSMTKQKLTASLEDYLEAILNITEQAGVARSKDIAEMLAVSRASVTGALKALKDKGLINYEPYGLISLTDAGKIAAEDIARRHSILKSFFIDVLGVQETVAQGAACKSEHVLGPVVIGKLLEFIEFVNAENHNGNDLRKKFEQFSKKHNKRKKNANGE